MAPRPFRVQTIVTVVDRRTVGRCESAGKTGIEQGMKEPYMKGVAELSWTYDVHK